MNKRLFLKVSFIVFAILFILIVEYVLFTKKEVQISYQSPYTTLNTPVTSYIPTSTLVTPTIKKVTEIKQISTIDKNNIYHNPTLGFRVTLPNSTWYASKELTDDDPHLYTNKKCSEGYGPNCDALEIQGHDSDSALKKGADAYFYSLKEYGSDPIKLVSLIPNAIVIRSKAPGPAEGWKYQYNVFFQSQKKIYLIFTNNLRLEKNILPTFQLEN